jgi:hypothetical protein
LAEPVWREAVVEWQTYRPRQIAWAVRNLEQAIARKSPLKLMMAGRVDAFG